MTEKKLSKLLNRQLTLLRVNRQKSISWKKQDKNKPTFYATLGGKNMS